MKALDAALAARSPRARESWCVVERALRQEYPEAWLVGGAVRDLALGRPISDLDLAVPGDPAPVLERLARGETGAVRLLEQTPRFGTASCLLEDGGDGLRLDVAAMRSETYARPGALPEPVFGASIEEDLRRRDFTVNAVALGLSGQRADEVVDPLDGLADLARGRLRVLHPRSFEDDATRLWRAARYCARLGLRPEPATAALIALGARWLATISGDRLWAEFARIATEPAAPRAFRLLEDWGVLESTSRGWHASADALVALRRLGRARSPETAFAVLTATLEARARDAALERLSPPSIARRALEDAVRLLAAPVAPTPEDLVPLERTGIAGREAARALAPEVQRPLQSSLRRWERTRPTLTAGALAGLGVPPGAPVGEWLRRLRRERYLGTLRTATEARALVRATLPSAGPHPLDRPARGGSR